MDLSPKRIRQILKDNGWELDRIKGSHHIYVKDQESVPVPIHGNQDLRKGTFLAILKKIGASKDAPL